MPTYKQGKPMPTDTPRSPQGNAEIWLRDNPRPESGTGTRAVHRWILSAANAFRERGLPADQAHDLIIANLTRNEKPSGEVAEAIAKAYGANVGSKLTGPAKPKWPEVDLALVEKIVADADGFGIADLQERSPIHFGDRLPHSAQVVEALLGCNDETLVCIGRSSYQFTTNSFGTLKDQLSGEQFIVPSPMSDRTWTKDSGELSEKGNANTGPRRNIVIEFDIAKLDKAGKPTKWAPLIEKWEAVGIATKDAMAALIWHLKQKGPLTCVVDSGGKSLHAWFYCASESEEPGSRLRKFFEYAVAIGADPATWTRSQFVRMPGGTRDNGNRQTVLYFDANGAGRAGKQQAADAPQNGAKEAKENFNTEGAENVKTENGNGVRGSGEEYERELTNNEMDAIIRDSYQWYVANGERLLGKEEYERRRVITDREFCALIEELKGQEARDFWDDPEEWLVPGDGYGISINRAARRAYLKLAASRKFFLRDGAVVRINSVNGVTRIEMVRPQEFRGIIEDHFKVMRVVKGNEEGSVKKIHAICSVETASAILENGTRVELPKIERVVDCPVIDQKGNICREGYHPHLNGGTYITGGKADVVPQKEAVASISELFSEYHFAKPADRLRAIAMLLTTAIAQGGLITGPIPVDVAEADDSQSGKTYRHKVAAAVYNEILSPIARQKGGVGSIDEALASALLSGRPFIQIDNLRDKLDSELMEAIITSDQANVRAPYRGSTTVSTKGLTLLVTSNGVEVTPDLANRCCIIRIRKRNGHQFKKYDEGDLLDHVRAKQGYYLGCVFAVLKAWIQEKQPVEADTRHSFRKWAASLNWIINRFFRAEDSKDQMLDGHVEIQKRASNPFAVILRAIAIELRDSDRLGNLYQASDLINIAESEAGVQVSGKDMDAKNTTFGRLIGRLYAQAKANKIQVEEFTITRETRHNPHRDEVKYYRFE